MITATAFYCGRINGQDVSFSQVYAAPIYLSPSFAGFTSGGRVILNYRDQWPGISNTFRAYSFSYDEFISKYNSGVGLLFLRDDQGAGQLISQNLGLNYAYELALTKDIYLRPGLQFKYSERKIDPSRLTQVGPDGEVFPWINAEFNVDQFKKIDATASVMIYNEFFWAGITMDNLVKNNIGFTDIESLIPMKTVVYGGGKLLFREAGRGRNEQSGTLAFMYRQQQSFHQLDLGAYYNTYPLEIGVWYRGIPGFSTKELSNNDALIFSLGLNIGPVHVAYSYDMTLSSMAGYSGGSNEFSLIYRFNRGPIVTRSYGPIPCTEPAHGWGEPVHSRRPTRRLLF